MLKSAIFPVIMKLLQAGSARQAKLKALYVIPNIFLVLGAIFGLVSLHIYLQESYSAVIANLSFASGFILLAIALHIYLAIRLKQAQQASQQANLSETTLNEVAELTGLNPDELNQSLNNVMQKHSQKVLLGTMIAGLLVGKNIKK